MLKPTIQFTGEDFGHLSSQAKNLFSGRRHFEPGSIAELQLTLLMTKDVKMGGE